MNLIARASILTAVLVSASITGCKSEQKPAKTEAPPTPAATQPLTVRDSARVTLSAKVKAINYTTRQVTLVDAAGHSVEFVAGPEIQRLNEVHVGDTVNVEYVASLLAELRPPTAEESANPLAAIAVAGRTPQGNDPGAGAGMATRIVTTVQAVDLPNMLVTLKGPMGDTTTVKARNPENVKKLHVGDTIVITYTEAVAVSLTKAAAR